MSARSCHKNLAYILSFHIYSLPHLFVDIGICALTWLSLLLNWCMLAPEPLTVLQTRKSHRVCCIVWIGPRRAPCLSPRQVERFITCCITKVGLWEKTRQSWCSDDGISEDHGVSPACLRQAAPGHSIPRSPRVLPWDHALYWSLVTSGTIDQSLVE